MGLKFLVFLALFYSISSEQPANPRSVLKKISSTIGDNILTCQSQMGFGDNITDAFVNFWSENLLEDQTLGCVVMCVLENLELLRADGSLKEENAVAFMTAKGADQYTQEILIELFNMCKVFGEDCYFGLELAKCFRAGIMMKGWKPDSCC